MARGLSLAVASSLSLPLRDLNWARSPYLVDGAKTSPENFHRIDLTKPDPNSDPCVDPSLNAEHDRRSLAQQSDRTLPVIASNCDKLVQDLTMLRQACLKSRPLAGRGAARSPRRAQLDTLCSGRRLLWERHSNLGPCSSVRVCPSDSISIKPLRSLDIECQSQQTETARGRLRRKAARPGSLDRCALLLSHVRRGETAAGCAGGRRSGAELAQKPAVSFAAW